jgi:hypothetical protein
VLGCPDLAVRVGIAGAHHGATVLKDLDVIDPWLVAECGSLCGPCFDHTSDVGHDHACESQRVIGMEAKDAASAALGLSYEQR